MGIKESALTAVGSITSSDFIRVVTSVGASRRISLANLIRAVNGGAFLSQIFIGNNASGTIDVASGSRGTIIFSCAGVGGRAIYGYGATGSGVVDGSWLVAPPNQSNITITPSTNTLTVQNNAGAAISACKISSVL